MITKNFKPNTKHRKWHDELAAMGCLITGSYPEIDHLIGASATQDGHWIGQWCVAPLCPYWHRTGPANRSTKRNIMQQALSSQLGRGVAKNLELELFLWTCANYVQHYNRDLPFGIDVFSAILRYCRG